MYNKLHDIATKCEVHNTHLDMAKTVHDALCTTIEKLCGEAQRDQYAKMDSNRIQQLLNLAYVVGDMFARQIDISEEIAQECYAAAHDAKPTIKTDTMQTDRSIRVSALTTVINELNESEVDKLNILVTQLLELRQQEREQGSVMFKDLRLALIRSAIDHGDLAQRLNLSEGEVADKLNGITAFTIGEAIAIKDMLPATLTAKSLFGKALQ